MKIGLLGGTFDPVHKGHFQLGKAALKQCKLSRVYFVLSPRSPFKSHRKSTSVKIRLQMLRSALKKQKLFSVGLWEINRRGLSYAVDTLRAVKRSKPQSEIYLILGSDLFPGFSRWKNPDKIKKMAKLVVGKRPGTKNRKYPKGTILLKGRFPNLSSTSIRNSKAGKKKIRSMVPTEVWSLIKKKELYQVA